MVWSRGCAISAISARCPEKAILPLPLPPHFSGEGDRRSGGRVPLPESFFHSKGVRTLLSECDLTELCFFVYDVIRSCRDEQLGFVAVKFSIVFTKFLPNSL